MFDAINISHIFVFDQEEALDFYVGKLGLEVSNDMNLGFMRWLTVRVPGDAGRDVLLELPGPPGMDEKTAAQVRETVSKGGSGFALGLTTSDCRKTYETLKAKGVEFSEEPTEHPSTADCATRLAITSASCSWLRHRSRCPRGKTNDTYAASSSWAFLSR